jgi:hypothetical protein
MIVQEHTGNRGDAPVSNLNVAGWRQGIRVARGHTAVSRKTVTSAQLYAILDREFKALRPKTCVRCRVPLPYFRKPPDEVSANWAIGTPSSCPNGCHLVIAELLAKLWTRYDIAPEVAQ